MLKPYFEFSSTDTINNPLYYFPPDRIGYFYQMGINPDSDKEKSKSTIVSPCKFMFPKYGIGLFFNDNSVTFLLQNDMTHKSGENKFVYPILYFLSFKSFMNYKIFRGFSQPTTSTLLKNSPETERISFNLGKILKKEHKDKQTGIKSYSYNVEPYILSLEKKEIEYFLSVLNINLLMSIVYYLNGCETNKYFLIEFYKSIESIQNYFKGEKNMKNKLSPYGFKKDLYKKLRKYANDKKDFPLDIGRHAPVNNKNIFSVDIKRLLEEPKSKNIFEDSIFACQSGIESFIKYLQSNKA